MKYALLIVCMLNLHTCTVMCTSSEEQRLLASLYLESGDLKNAYALYRSIIQIEPESAQNCYNLGYTLLKLGYTKEACHWFRQAIDYDEQFQIAYFAYACSLLAQGNYQRGWQYLQVCNGLDDYRYIEWLKDRSFAGKKVVIHSAWGIGDALQFLRYAYCLKKAGAITILAQVNAPIERLLLCCPYIDEVISYKQKPPEDAILIPLFSLPYVFNTTLETIPTPIPYIVPDEQLCIYWQQRLAQDESFKIGICWQSNNALNMERYVHTRRSIDLKLFLPLMYLPNITLYSLQKGCDEQLSTFAQQGLINTFERFDQEHGAFMDTAAIMQQLDLIISVDTSVAHLAGALGCPTWVLLPFSAEWRWLEHRTDSPWYPTMRLFGQQEPGNWQQVIAAVVQALDQVIDT